MNKNPDVFKFSGDEIECWIEPDTCIMLRAIAHGGKDPVEVTGNEALRIAQRLTKMAYIVDPELLND